MVMNTFCGGPIGPPLPTTISLHSALDLTVLPLGTHRRLTPKPMIDIEGPEGSFSSFVVAGFFLPDLPFFLPALDFLPALVFLPALDFLAAFLLAAAVCARAEDDDAAATATPAAVASATTSTSRANIL